jgi:hypothetical protein
MQRRNWVFSKAIFKGDGLQPNVAGASWEKIRDLFYGERG